MKNNLIIGLLVIIIFTGYITWAKSYTRLKDTIPYARVLLELKQLRDAGSDAEADALLDQRLKYMSETLQADGLPFPPKEGITIAKEIDQYMERHQQPK